MVFGLEDRKTCCEGDFGPRRSMIVFVVEELRAVE